jgi:DMSO/TMAO reductase YedYZ molybdopterin-dependent catalytic subunit
LFWRKKPSKRLPPNQKSIKSILKWGIDHPGITKNLPKTEKKDWKLRVDGDVENQTTLDWRDFDSLPKIEALSDFHCVEGWSVIDQKWEGVPFSRISKLVKPRPTCRFVWFECADGYTTSLPLEKLMEKDVILAHRLNGGDLPQSLGGPVRLVVPNLYTYKSPMWLTRITFIREDKLGYWESGNYSNDADVWLESRYNR